MYKVFLSIYSLEGANSVQSWWFGLICSDNNLLWAHIDISGTYLQHRGGKNEHIYLYKEEKISSVAHSDSAVWSAFWSGASWLLRELRHDSTAVGFSSSLSVFWWPVPSSSQSELQNYKTGDIALSMNTEFQPIFIYPCINSLNCKSPSTFAP